MPKKAAMKSKKMKKPKTKNKKGNQQALMLKPVKDPSDTPLKISTNIIKPETVRSRILYSVPPTELEKGLLQVQYPLNNIHKMNKLEMSKKSQCSLKRDEVLDKLLQSEFQEKVGENRHPISSLHIFEKREEILDLINTNPVVVICGEPECGKTTQIPQFILDDCIKSGNGSLCKIVSTQPYKRNVTRAVDKVSEERRGIFGNSDGINYQFRFHKSISRNLGSITYCTSGILMKQVANSSFLSKITHVIIDEIQERDIPTDFLLTFMKELISTGTHIKLILICTSVYSKKITKYFNKCVKINVSPELYSVEEYFLEEIMMLTNFNNLAASGDFEKDKIKQEKERKYPKALKTFVETYEKLGDINCLLIISLIKYICTKYHYGNILILVPTISNIQILTTKIEQDNSLNSKTQVTTLTQFDISTKDNTFNTNRKIYLTKDERFVDLNKSNIVFVIDSGRIRVNFYDIITNVEIVKFDWISQKSSKQRKQLAGRYKSGVCFHLFSQDSIQNFDKYPIPEIMKCNLDKIILEIKEFGIKNAELFLKNGLTSPDIYCVRQTIENLKNHHILTNEEYLTPLGSHIVKLPLKYAVGKMVIFGAFFNCLEPILTIAAYLNFRSVFNGKDKEIYEIKRRFAFLCDSDILLILNLLNEFEKSRLSEDDFFEKYLILPTTFKDIDNIKQQLTDRLFDMNILPTKKYKLVEYNKNSKNMNLIKALLSIALYPNIAVIRNHTSDRLKNICIETLSQKNVVIDNYSLNSVIRSFPTPLLLYRSCCGKKYNCIQETTFVTPLQVLFFANDVKYSTENQESHSVIIVADCLKIFCSKSTSSIIQFVQENFNKWFDYKLRNPAFVDWKKDSWDTSILRAVIDLLESEDKVFLYK